MDYHYALLIFICCWIPGFGKLPVPTNVFMESINFRNILRWNRPADLGDNVMYTVQYKMDLRSNRDTYKNICQRTYEHQCDSSIITYKSFVRVRTELDSKESDWVTINFDPDNQTIIGAPKAKVSSRSGYLDVSFEGPFVNTDRRPIKEKYGELNYKVLYWKESEPAHVLQVTTGDNTEILHDLETWTVYCVKVQAYVPFFVKYGEFSPVMCEKTTEDGKTPSWKIALLFLGSMVLLAVLVLLLTYVITKAYKITRYIFFPSYTLPEHLKEYLSRPFSSAPHLPAHPAEECGESCEQLTFISEETDEMDAA
ncbi:interleukin-10 receptor subunit beta-like [Anomaloglossus baeobatrachus]|uniref:interleukin-10 receptor subunit beta-like n=1 Tax=Anomaloglossus baeobatrachus TaxID=238106 RepID=UPI003F50BD83